MHEITLAPGETLVHDFGGLGSVRLRVHDGKPSYDPESVTLDDVGVEFEAGVWGDTHRVFGMRKGVAVERVRVSVSEPEEDGEYEHHVDGVLVPDYLPAHQRESVLELLRSGIPANIETGKQHLAYYAARHRKRQERDERRRRIEAEAQMWHYGDWTVRVQECSWDESLRDCQLIWDTADDDRPPLVVRNTVGLRPGSITDGFVDQARRDAQAMSGNAGLAVRHLLSAEPDILDDYIDDPATVKDLKRMAVEAEAAHRGGNHPRSRRINQRMCELLRGTVFCDGPDGNS